MDYSFETSSVAMLGTEPGGGDLSGISTEDGLSGIKVDINGIGSKSI